MEKSEIKEKLIPIFTKYIANANDVLTENTELLSVVDSLTMLEVVFAIEETFGVDVPDEHLPKMITLKDVIDGVYILLTQSGS
jgi:acyl carrier protein